MSQKIKNIFLSSLPAIILSSLLAVAVIYAFTEPTKTPPQGNVPAPINVSSTPQTFLDSKTLKVKDDGTGILSIEGGIWGKGIGVFNGSVGIGTTAPVYKLQVGDGQVSSSSTVLIISKLDAETSLNIGYAGFNDLWRIVRPAGNDSLAIQRGTTDVVRFSQANGNTNFNSGLLFINAANSTVGIGTTNPQAKLDVAGQIRISGGNPAQGKVLTAVDNNGLASWQPVKAYDCRVCVQISDRGCVSQFGSVQCTPWASENGGWSDWATDTNAYDPDCVRVKLECR
jgi:hypothetical protein